MMRLPPCLLTATLLCLLGPSWAMACQGQVGKTIFEDDFSDDSGGWDLSNTDIKIKDSALVVAFAGQMSRYSMVPAFNVAEGDFCMDVVLPPPVGDNDYGAGLNFWESSYSNRFIVAVFTNRNVLLAQIVDGKPTYIGGANKAPSIHTGPSAANELRAVVKGGKVAIFLNGIKIKAFRVQQPNGPLHFGVAAQVDKPSPQLPPVRITHFKVTSGE